MTQIGTIEYKAKVSGVAEAKKNAQDFADSQRDVEAASNSSAAATGFLAAKMGRAEDAQDEATESAGRFDVASKLLASSLFWLGSSAVAAAGKITGLTGAFTAARGAASWLMGTLSGLTLSGVVGTVTGALKSFVGWLAAGSAGALAVGAAIGTAIGVFGVWILKITGVLDKIKQLGRWVGGKLPAWARDGVLSIIGLFLGPFAAIGGFIVGTLEGGFSEGFSKAKKIIGIFEGAWGRTWSRIKNTVGKGIDFVISKFNWLKNKATNLIGDIGSGAAGAFEGAFNSVVPSKLNIPSVKIGGQSIAGQKIPSVTIGGGSINLPQLASGGMIQEAGIAQVHKGEAVIPQPIVDAAKGSSGGGDSITKVEQIVVELSGDFDPSDMSRRELESLADELVDLIGKKTNAKAGVR